MVKVSGPDSPSAKTRDTSPKRTSIKVVMRAVMGLSGIIARMNAVRSGWSQPGTHVVADRTPSVQRSSQRLRIRTLQI